MDEVPVSLGKRDAKGTSSVNSPNAQGGGVVHMEYNERIYAETALEQSTSALGGEVEKREGVESVQRKKRRRFGTLFKSGMTRNRIGNSLCDALGRKPLHFHVRSIE